MSQRPTWQRSSSSPHCSAPRLPQPTASGACCAQPMLSLPANWKAHAASAVDIGRLPAPRAGFAGQTVFAPDALLEPARTVGGNFYDCFMVNNQRLFFVVGYVSGKWLAASLLLALSQLLL